MSDEDQRPRHVSDRDSILEGLPRVEMQLEAIGCGSAGGSVPRKLNWTFYAPLSPLNYSSRDGALETKALGA